MGLYLESLFHEGQLSTPRGSLQDKASNKTNTVTQTTPATLTWNRGQVLTDFTRTQSSHDKSRLGNCGTNQLAFTLFIYLYQKEEAIMD